MKIQPIEDGNSKFHTVILKNDTIDTIDTKETPHCVEHGAMNKVSVFKEGGGYWRCCVWEGLCRI